MSWNIASTIIIITIIITSGNPIKHQKTENVTRFNVMLRLLPKIINRLTYDINQLTES